MKGPLNRVCQAFSSVQLSAVHWHVPPTGSGIWRVWLAVISLTFGSSKYEESYTIIYSHWLSMNYVLYFLAPHRKWHCTAVWENPIKIGACAWIVVVLSFSSQRANFCLFFGHLSLFLLFLWQALLVLKMLDQGGGCASENATKT